MSRFLKRVDLVEESFIKAIKNSGKIVEITYSDGTSRMFTEFDAIIAILHADKKGDPQIVDVYSDDKSGAAGLLAALWVSLNEYGLEPEDPTKSKCATNEPGVYFFYDWYNRPVDAYWDGGQWKYKGKSYSTDEILKLLRPYGRTNAFKPQE